MSNPPPIGRPPFVSQWKSPFTFTNLRYVTLRYVRLGGCYSILAAWPSLLRALSGAGRLLRGTILAPLPIVRELH